MSHDPSAANGKKKRFPVQLDLSAPAVPKRPWDYATKTSPLKASSPVRTTPVTSPPKKTVAPPLLNATDSGNMASLRLRMAQRLYANGIHHEALLKTMAHVPRHIFVDSALRNQAYEDTSLPIGLEQTISKPSVVARMIELILPTDGRKLGRILDIGTGCGYQASVLSALVNEVYSIERLKILHEKARDNLRPLRLKNVHLILGDGMRGFPSGAPYDAIIAAAGGEEIPLAWLEQIAVGGVIVAPISGTHGQFLVKIERTHEGWLRHELDAVQFVPLKSGVS